MISFGVVPLVLSPYFLTLCYSKFEAYEEAIAYEFLAGLLLAVWCINLSLRPAKVSFIFLCLVAGLAPFIRPTAIFYGMASIVIGAAIMWRRGSSVSFIFLGIFAFLAGVSSLLWSNDLRFGSPWEFGHSLTLNGVSEMRYALRFDHPYRNENPFAAATELFCLLFLNRTPTGDTWPFAYGDNMFLGQTETFRWREHYISTYDWTCLIMLSVAWVWAGIRLSRRFLQKRDIGGDALDIIAIWSLLAVIPLFGFYLRGAFISSRYLFDFAPSFVLATWVFWETLLHKMPLRWKHHTLNSFVAIVLVIWWMYEVGTIKGIGKSTVMDYKAVSNIMRMPNEPARLPLFYTNGFDFASTRIPHNGSGWRLWGATEASVALFVNDPQFVIVDVTSTNFTHLLPEDCEGIQAKIGLEVLEREHADSTRDGVRLTFRQPSQQRYQRGIQLLCLGMVKPAELSTNCSQFRLLRVAWQPEPPNSRKSQR